MNTSTPNAKFFFLELGTIAALYISVISFITFSFDIINYMFPDRQAFAFDPYAGSMRFALSTLIVVFPIFLFLAHSMWKMLLADVPARGLAVRRWLSYLTLFVAGAVIAGDLVTLVNTFLNGEITARFTAKVAVVLLVAAAVFAYTLKDMKGVFFEKPQLFKKLMIGISVVVLASIIGGLVVIGLPASQRDLRDDQQRASDLQMIQGEVVNYYQRTGALPENTSALVDPLYPYVSEYLNDPATEAPYEYSVIASTTPMFELCATFALASRTNEYEGRGSYPEGFSSRYSYVGFYPPQGDAFEHTEGRNCFTRIIDPARYPVMTAPEGSTTAPALPAARPLQMR